MKKLFFVTLSSLLIVNIASSQMIASLDVPEDVEYNSSKKVINDIRAIDEIRMHLLKDRELKKVFNYYVNEGLVKAEITVDENGLLSEVKIVESLSREHDQLIVKSIRKIGKVNPIIIDGQKVKQKIVLPIYFR